MAVVVVEFGRGQLSGGQLVLSGVSLLLRWGGNQASRAMSPAWLLATFYHTAA